MTLLPMVLMASSAVAPLTPGAPLPLLKGEFLTGRRASLPDAASGKVTLLALGFTYNSRFAVEAWVGQFRKDYGENPRVSFYEIPMIGGLAQLGKWFIDSGMRKGTPASDYENVITVYGGTEAWKKRVGYCAPDDAYLILLDEHGTVRWMHQGKFDPAVYRELRVQAKGQLGERRR